MIDLQHEVKNFMPIEFLGEKNPKLYDAYNFYNRALEEIGKNNEDNALKLLKKAIRNFPEFPPAKLLMGVIFFAKGDRVGSLKILNSIIDDKYKEMGLSYYDYLAIEADKEPEFSCRKLILRELYRGTVTSDEANINRAIFESEENKKETYIKSRQNDGVVEQIVKLNIENAQKAAMHSGMEKNPFSYDKMYQKKKLTSKPFVEGEKEKEIRDEIKHFLSGTKENIVLSVGSVIVLVYVVIISVALMNTVTENRQLKNNVKELQNAYDEAMITPAPTLYFEPTPKVTEAPTPTPEGYIPEETAITAEEISEG